MPSKTSHFYFCFLPQAQFLLLACGLWLGGYWLMLPTIFLTLAIPLLDHLTGWRDSFDLGKQDFAPWQVTLLEWNTRVYALLHLAVLLTLCIYSSRFSLLELAMLVPGIGMLSVIGFGCAHELMHSAHKIDRHLQHISTKFLFYPHYQLIHIRSHHPLVGTPQDQNTARLNEGIYAYLWRTIPGSARQCWRLEEKRLTPEKSRLRRWYKNKMVGHAAGQIIILIALAYFAGMTGLLFFQAQMVFSHFVLEGVNYMQHYGLLRPAKVHGYVRLQAQHSWDTYHFFSSYVTFRVGHHSSHHLVARPYYLLGTEQEAPQLPAGYFISIFAVFVPPLWRRWINPRIAKAEKV